MQSIHRDFVLVEIAQCQWRNILESSKYSTEDMNDFLVAGNEFLKNVVCKWLQV